MRGYAGRLALGAVLAALVPLRASGAQGFTLSPGWACDGDRIALRWTGELGARLSAAWESAGGSGMAPFSGVDATHDLRGTTVFRLTAEHGTTRDQTTDTVEVHPPTLEHNWQRAPACAGRLSVSSTAIPPARASDRIKPRSVTNRGAEPVLVWHRGRSVRLLPGESSEAFNDVPFSGDWGVIVDRGPYNLTCPQRPESTSPPLYVVIVTACALR